LDQLNLENLGNRLNLYFLGILDYHLRQWLRLLLDYHLHLGYQLLLGILYHQLLQLLLDYQLNHLNQDHLEDRLILGILHYLDYQ